VKKIQKRAQLGGISIILKLGGFMGVEKPQDSALGIEDVLREEDSYLGSPNAKERWALCLSGGGIRSATFCLGVLQGLARRALLSRFKYISTVSGGGYIGSWLSRWIQEVRGDVIRVEKTLATNASPGSVGEPSQIRNLRAYSNYLSPVWGFSTDFFTLISIYLRNSLLNWLVLVPLIAAAVLIPMLYLSIIGHPGLLVDGATITSCVAAFLVAIGIAYVVADLPDDHEQGGNLPDNFIVLCLTPIVLGALLLSVSASSGKAWLSDWGYRDFSEAGAAIHLVGSLIGLIFRKVKQLKSRKEEQPTPDIESQRLGSYQQEGTWRWMRVTVFDVLFILLSGAFGGLAFYWVTQKLSTSLLADPIVYSIFAPPSLLLCFWLATTIYVGPARYICSENEREWWARSGGWWLQVSLFWIVGCTIVLLAPQWINGLPAFQGLSQETVMVSGGLSGVLISLLGYWSKQGTKFVDKTRSFATKVGVSMLELAAIAFIIGLLISLSFALAKINCNLQENACDNHGKKTVTPLNAQAINPNKKEDSHKEKVNATLEILKSAAQSTELAARAAEASITTTLGKQSPRIPNSSENTLQPTDIPKIAATASTTNQVNLSPMSSGEVNERAVKKFKEAAIELNNVSKRFQSNPLVLGQAAEMVAKTAEIASKSGNNIIRADSRHGKDMSEAIKNVVEAATTLVTKKEETAKNFSETANQYENWIRENRPQPTFWLFLGLCAFAAIASLSVGVNTFSLHSLYGNRLVRAYFGAAREHAERNPHRFTGFDFSDNIDMAELQYRNPRQLHIVNLALNLVAPSGDRLEWQQRKAASFTVSALHSGSEVLGYISSESYAGPYPRGISLARAMTISGAAASSNMGYHSSPAVTFVMTLFNARLGWWLPNPLKAGPQTMARGEPLWSLNPILWEAFGLTTKNRAHIHVSDGGHFDNLGLYEMVRRRCTRIVVVDATCDPQYSFEDLQDTIRKIRVDLRVSIDIPAHSLASSNRYIVGTIRYKDIDISYPNGKLYILKPTIKNDEPVDVLHYEKQSKRRSLNSPFPHESTADQFFDEPQFESYRMLGLHTVDKTFGPADNWDWPVPPSSPITPAVAVGSGNDKPEIAKATPAVTETHDGLLSSIGNTVQSMSQGALLASAITVGGVLGVGGTIALQNPTVSLQPGSELSISKESLNELRNITLKAEQPSGNRLDSTVLITALNELRSTLSELQKYVENQRELFQQTIKVTNIIDTIETRLRKVETNQVKVTSVTDPNLVQALNSAKEDIRKELKAIHEKIPTQLAQPTPLLSSVEKSLLSIEKLLNQTNESLRDAAPRRNVRGVEGGGK
jgi:hypothetical protein